MEHEVLPLLDGVVLRKPTAVYKVHLPHLAVLNRDVPLVVVPHNDDPHKSSASP